MGIVGVGESEREVVSPHTPRHHVTSTHLVWRWHVTPEKQHFVTGKGHNDHLTTLWLHPMCYTRHWPLKKRKASWKENRKNHDSAGAKEPEQRQQRLGHTTGLTDCFRRDLVVRNSLNGNLLLNKENRENLESAGELPETDSRMYQTLKRMCHNTKTL